MPQACTIYGATSEQARVADLAEAIFGTISLDGARDAWASLTVRGLEGELVVNALVYRQNGDEFTRLRLTTYMAAKRVEATDETAKSRVTGLVKSSELILGIVATPSLDVDDRYHQLVFDMGRATSGIIFDGSEFLDPDGTTLLELG